MIDGDVYVMAADGLGSPRHFYFACPHCGWCGPLRDGRDAAATDGAQHFTAKNLRAEIRQPEAAA